MCVSAIPPGPISSRAPSRWSWATALTGPVVRAVRADGVRLSATMRGGRLSLGTLDRLLPGSSGGPFALPAIRLGLADTRVRLATPAGTIDARIAGDGGLAGGFVGRIAAVAPRLATGGCRIAGAAATLDVSITNRRPQVAGPLRVAGSRCAAGDTRLAGGGGWIGLRLGPALHTWTGSATVQGFAGRTSGIGFGPLGGRLTFDGSGPATDGTVDLTLADVRSAPASAQTLAATGRFRISTAAHHGAFAGVVRAEGMTLAPDRRRALLSTIARANGTPLGPLAMRAGRSLSGLLGQARAAATIEVRGDDGGSELRVSRAEARGPDGAVIVAERGHGFGWRNDRWSFDGTLAARGGRLPAVDATIARADATRLDATIRMAPYAAGGAALAVTPVALHVANGIGRFATVATLSGPLAGGRIEGLEVPLVGRVTPGGLRIGEGCATVGFRRIALAGARLDPARLRLCGTPVLARDAAGRVRIDARLGEVALAGRSGSAPLAIRAGAVRFGASGFAVDDLAVRLGEPVRLTTLDAAKVTGHLGTEIGGDFAGTDARIGGVPLLLQGASGSWAFHGNRLALAGTLRVADADAAPRFKPLSAHDAALSLAGGRIDATATLTEPTSGAKVAGVTIRHDLGRGAGEARLDVPGLVFARGGLQPEALTPLTLGVIANTAGTVAGTGTIRWNPAGVASGGRFHTDRLDFAAAFGPVTGVSGTIAFSDLLGLVTPPGQEVRVATVNPGVPVTDGIARYQVSGNRVIVEGARWPFAGGTLTLEPASLDLSSNAERRLTFRIADLDAAAFVQQLDFPNISATGRFDGVLPMIFDERGGRIETGSLAARRPGTLAYVGELSQADIGTMAKLAFDALKAIRYDALDIRLDGRLDGEMVSRVRFEGVRQATGDRTLVARMIRNLPFRFTIDIHAPFRGLVGSARSFADPSLLLVQRPASAPVR